MKLKVLLLSLLLAAMGGSLSAQNAAPIQGGNISASSSNCSASFSCVWESVLPQNAGTTTINISGTFTATLLVEESNNGGQSWSTANPSATGTTTYSTNGFTDIRVRCSAYTSGTAVVSISTGLLQVQSVVSGSSSGSTSSLTTLIDVTAPPYNVKTGVIISDATWATGSNPVTVTSAGQATFTAAMNGWAVFGTASCASNLTNQIPTLPQGTLTFVNSTTITVNVGATANSTGNGCLMYGPIMDTQLAAVDAAAALLPDCTTYLLPAGAVFIQSSHFTTKSASCNGNNVEAQGGPEIFGWGRDISRLVLLPNFNMASCTAGASNNVCFGGLFGMLWKDWSIFGGYNSRLGSTSSKILVQVSTAGIFDNWICSGFGAYDSNLIALEDAGGEAIFDTIVLNGCGNVGFHENGAVSGIHALMNASLGNINGPAVKVEGTASLHMSFNRMGGLSSGNQAINLLTGGQLWSYGDICDNVAATYNVCIDNNGGIANIDGLRCDMSLTSTGTCILNDAGTPTTYIRNSWTKAGATGNDINRLNGTVFDQNGNHFTTNQFSGFAPTCAMTTGGGTGPACALVAGSTNEKGTVRMTPGTTPGTSGTTTVTFAGTFSGATSTTPSCTFTYAQTGTGTWTPTAPAMLQSRSTTVPVFSWAATVTAASTYDVDYVCIAR